MMVISWQGCRRKGCYDLSWRLTDGGREGNSVISHYSRIVSNNLFSVFLSSIRKGRNYLFFLLNAVGTVLKKKWLSLTKIVSTLQSACWCCLMARSPPLSWRVRNGQGSEGSSCDLLGISPVEKVIAISIDAVTSAKYHHQNIPSYLLIFSVFQLWFVVVVASMVVVVVVVAFDLVWSCVTWGAVDGMWLQISLKHTPILLGSGCRYQDSSLTVFLFPYPCSFGYSIVLWYIV